jgi:hypothetical protein
VFLVFLVLFRNAAPAGDNNEENPKEAWCCTVNEVANDATSSTERRETRNNLDVGMMVAAAVLVIAL